MTIKYYQSKVSWQTFEQKLCEDFFDSAIFWDLSWPLALASSSCVLAVSGKFLAEYAKRDSIIPLTGLPEVAWWKWLKIMWTGEVRNGEQKSFVLLLICDWIITEVKIYVFVDEQITSCEILF